MTKVQRNDSGGSKPIFHKSRRTFALPAWLAIVVILAPVATLLGGDGSQPRELNAPAPLTATAKPTFDKVGPQVGDQLPDLKLRTLKGEPQRLSDAWHGGPTLIVTSSFTCPKSRSRWPEVKAIVDKYGEKLNVVIVYVIEAHPVGSVCPYKGVEEVTPENQRDGILRHQPKTLDDRLDLAQEFKRYLRVDVPIYIDMLDNQAWKAFGAAPNIAFLVDSQGIVAARQGWFDGAAMQKSIDTLVSKRRGSNKDSRIQERMSREDEQALDAKLALAGLRKWDLLTAMRSAKPGEISGVIKRVPSAANFIFSIQQTHQRETTWLMEAVNDRSLVAARVLLENGADVKARTSSYDSALQEAAEVGQPEMVKLLLSYHAEVNYPAIGKAPLHEALIAGHSDIARMLIEAGAEEDFCSDVGLGKTDSVRKALADPSWALRPDGADRMPLEYAAANNQLEIAKLLLESGAPVVDDELSRMKAPLHYAINSGYLAMAELLLNAGSSPNTALGRRGESPTSEPPLHMAIATRNVDMIKLLLRYKPDLSRRNTFSETALHYAAYLGNAEMAELLIRAGADVNAPQLKFDLPCGSGEEDTPSFNTPLHFAAACGSPDTIMVLLKGGAKIEARNVYERTPLMSTVYPPLYTQINEKSQLKNMELLLSSGADVNARDKEGQTVLDIAIDELNAEVGPSSRAQRHQAIQGLVDLLRKHGAKPGEPKKQK